MLLFLDGQTEAEVGEVLELPQQTVNRRKQAGLKSLRVAFVGSGNAFLPVRLSTNFSKKIA